MSESLLKRSTAPYHLGCLINQYVWCLQHRLAWKDKKTKHALELVEAETIASIQLLETLGDDSIIQRVKTLLRDRGLEIESIHLEHFEQEISSDRYDRSFEDHLQTLAINTIVKPANEMHLLIQELVPPEQRLLIKLGRCLDKGIRREMRSWVTSKGDRPTTGAVAWESATAPHRAGRETSCRSSARENPVLND